LHAEFGEFLEHIQVSGTQLGGLGAGHGEDGVQGFASRGGRVGSATCFGGLGKVFVAGAVR
jgi:hypothetical protein